MSQVHIPICDGRRSARRSTLLGAMLFLTILAGASAVPVAQALPAQAPNQLGGKRVLSGHVPAVVARLTPLNRLSATKRLNLAIGLPLRNQDALNTLLQQIYDPASPHYRQYLTPEQFAAMFGPTEQDYQAVIAFAKSNGLTVAATYPNRVVLDVEGAVTDIEKALHVTMRVYQHPKEARTFYAPDVEPSPDLTVPILHISGLDDYTRPVPRLVRKPAGKAFAKTANATGSGPGGTYLGYDFRDAYVPGTTLTGTGQSVALFELDGYYTNDIGNYEKLAGLPSVPLVNVGSVTPGVNGGIAEVSLDIEMVVSMAPGLSQVYVYEGLSPDSVLARIASDNLAKQVSSSWGWTPSPDLTADGIFQEMAAQGQTFFNAVGDSDAFSPGTADNWAPTCSTNITQVGGTTLTTTGPGGSYVSETVWNWGGGVGSSGGISTYYAMPGYQQGISMVANHGSTTMRNVPDVALTADNVYVIANNGSANGEYGGTSCAAPLWAAFTALINQQNGGTPVGFLNPAFYAIGKRADYTNCFHDTTTGNNYRSGSPTNFPAVAGYDLCTGWGTPNGRSLIFALTEPFQITPATSFLFTGPVGGSFSPLVQRYSLSNTGTNTLNWILVNPASWLNVSPTSGAIPAGGTAATVTVSVASAAASLPAGSYAANLTFTNLNDNSSQTRQVTLAVVTMPVITSQPTNQAALEGAAAVFAVGTSSNALMFYQWRDNGTNLTDGGNISGSATSNLVIASVSAAAVGAYSVVVSNVVGLAVSSNALLTIVPSIPVITAPPADQTVLPGQTVTLTVTTVGTHPFFYQWRENGTNLTDGGNISGSTAVTMTISNVSSANAGTYAVVVSNSLGAVTSSSATLAVTSVTAPGITLARLYSFGGSDGENPYGPLAQGAEGNLYGTTVYGGHYGYGTIFRMTTNGTLTNLFSFNGANGTFPCGGLMQTSDGNLYGTTFSGGSHGYGTIFRMTTNGTLATLVSFNSTNGAYPYSGLAQSTDGSFYGTTYEGGSYGYGTIFRVTTNGMLTTLVSFNSTDGAYPYSGLVQSTDGSFYGTTCEGGARNAGTVFKMTPTGTLTTLYSFNGYGSYGAYPVAGLMLNSDGNFLYGTTEAGGSYGDGTIFRIALNGSLATLANFDGYQGEMPQAALIRGADGNLYGTAFYGGAGFTGGTSGYGVIFKLNDINGSLQQTITNFSPIDGSSFATTNVVLLSAQASSGLAVTNFTVISGPGVISGLTILTFTNSGSVSVTANQAGDTNWSAAPTVTNTFNVTKATASVTLTNLNQTYNGTPRVVTAATLPAGMKVDITYNGNAWAPTNPGSYAVLGIVNDAMFQGSTNGTLVVTAAADLSLMNLVFLPAILTTNQHPGAVSVQLINYGPMDLASPNTRVVIDFHLSQNTTFGDGDDISLGNYTSDQIVGAGQRITVVVPAAGRQGLMVPATVRQGMYNVFARVRHAAPSILMDPDESNNYVMRNGAILVTNRTGGITTPSSHLISDFDGDGRADPAVYQMTSGRWEVMLSGDGYQTTSFVFGGAGYAPVLEDYDGDGKSDPAVYAGSNGKWQMMLSGSGYATASGVLGGTGYIPVPADFDGDGRADPAVYQITSGRWTVLLSGSGYKLQYEFEYASPGENGPMPVPADYDGDGKSDLTVYWKSTGDWYFILSTLDAFMVTGRFGDSGSVPAPADFDGDGKTDPAVYKESSGEWSVMLSQDNYAVAQGNYGGNGYVAVSADYDGDGKSDLGVYNANLGKLKMLLSGSGYRQAIGNIGGPGYVPVGVVK